ncbi:hypothetical protein F4802DRAFT_612459 [Xylaria palmicola]|nr:hypothetical protein F4802DRAFT_612459 [Xylaria palmicola]
MTPRWTRIWALLFLLLRLHGVVAGPLQLSGREDTVSSVRVEPTPTTAGNEAGDDEASPEVTDGTRSTRRPTGDGTATVVSTSATVFATPINGNSPDNRSSLATPNPIPDGQLPIQPRLTPGWGIAGAILLICGATYTLIGIKNAWLHTFFSAAFLSGLSVTVLIVYVMTPPVPAAIEGAYVVAAVVAGLILGGVATVFHEITEGLGCLLGGFCLSMWLLTLKPGGLLPSMPAKAIFITAFSIGSYAFYFSHYTRPYALMGLMSFAGGTVTVMGIDCFSKAGLKEFWAYIWDLNKGLFPYAAVTYPLTKGIRVEIATTVVFTIVGIISQLKLWRVVQEHRAKKAEEEAEAQRKREEEEANIGLQIEAQNARERQQWETVYGNQPSRSSVGSGDSGVEDVDDEKKDRVSQTVDRQESSNTNDIEMSELPQLDFTSSLDAVKSADGLIVTNQEDDGKVTIRVARDDGPAKPEDKAPVPGPSEKVWLVNGDGEARPSSLVSPPVPQAIPKPPGPEITPLPFKIPVELEGDDSRSSIAAYAGEDDGDYVLSKKPSRMSLANRLSTGSGNLLQSLSPRGSHSKASKRRSGEFVMQQPQGWAGSTEELVENSKRHSDDLSVAATIDGLSQDGEAYDYFIKDGAERMSIPTVTVHFGEDNTETDPTAQDKEDSELKLKPPTSGWNLTTRPTSSAETVGTDILDPSIVNSSTGDLSKRSSLNQSTRKTESSNENSNPTDTTAEAASENSPPPKSLAPSDSSTSMSLTKDRLPSALPRVALSYRTNEWAKHLSTAEAPLLEQLQLDEYLSQPADEEKPKTEAAVPVDVEELQRTADSDAPPAVIIRSSSSTSHLPSRAYHSISRTSSYPSPPKAHIPATLAILTNASSDVGAQSSQTKPTPSNSPQAGHSFRNKGRRKSSEVYNQPIQEESISEALPVDQPVGLDDDDSSTPNSTPPSPTEPAPLRGVVPYTSTQTLLGKREMFLRNKSQSQLFTTPPIQENTTYIPRPASQMASPYPYAAAPAPPPLTIEDADDIPLSQRKALIRQSSIVSVNSAGGRAQRNASWSAAQPVASSPTTHIHTITAELSHFDSHQPQRHASGPSPAERDARLSRFRQSVAADLRAASPAPATRETPMLRATSSISLAAPSPSSAEIGWAIDQQRSALRQQREQEGQRREAERQEKERQERAFEEMMRRGDLLDAHREALRRMQGGVKHE